MTRTRAVAAATLCLIASAAQAGAAPPEGPAPFSVQVVSRVRTQIGAPMAGKLVSFPLRDGDRFKAGDVIAKFQCDQQAASLARARAEAAKRRNVMASQQKLRSGEFYSALDYQTAQAEVQVAAADLQAAQVGVSNCEVRAPFRGRVSSTAAREFQFVAVGAPLAEILDDADLEVEAVVPSDWLSWMRPGTAFSLEARETGRGYKAEVVRVSGSVDAVSQTVKVYGRIVGDAEGLLPGMSGSGQAER